MSTGHLETAMASDLIRDDDRYVVANQARSLSHWYQSRDAVKGSVHD